MTVEIANTLSEVRTFIQELKALSEGTKPYPTEGSDLILHCVRIAKGDPQYEFTEEQPRTAWKTLAFPILYGMNVFSTESKHEAQ